MPKTYKFEISSRTILFTIGLLLLLKLLVEVKELIFALFIAFIVMSALNPMVSWLEQKRIPRTLSALVMFIGLFTIIGYLFAAIIPPVVSETGLLFKNLPAILRELNPEIPKYFDISLLSRYAPNITSNAFGFIRNVFSNVVFVISTVFFSFFFLIETHSVKKFVMRLFDDKDAARIIVAIEKAEKRMRTWFWGQLTLMLIIGIFTFIGLTILNVRYALSLALFAGLLEIVPVLGPTISAVPAVLVTLSDSYFAALTVVALYVVIQQLENQVFVPLVMRKVVGLNPIVTLAALIVGGKIAGFFGVLLAIPATLFLETVFLEIASAKNSSPPS